ncbi:MAG TPA: lipoate--protein ligase family protein [bacterium]|nr:lipoate--protein ligase family protein [bacterium]
MAVDEILLRREHPLPVLRLYQWDRATLSLGMSQELSRHVLPDPIRTLGIPVIRRLTGGKAVLHDRELTYSVTGPMTCRPFSGDLLASYRDIAEAFCDAFHSLGIPAEMAPGNTRAVKGAVTSCFANPSSFEIVVNGRKLLGSAQKRTRNRVLQHGSLLIRYHGDDWTRIMRRHDPGEAGRVTDLETLLGETFSLESVINALLSGFRRRFEVDLIPTTLSDTEMKAAEELARSRYRDLTGQLDSACR